MKKKTFAALLTSIFAFGACAAPQAASDPQCAPTAEKSAEAPLLLRGVPEIPDALKTSLGRFLDARSASLLDVSADGQAVLISTRFGQTEQLHLVSQPLGMRRQLTFKDEPVRIARFVPGSSSDIVYMSDQGGNEQYQLFHLDLSSGTTTMISDGQSRHGSFLFSPDGKQLAYTNNARNGRDMDIYLGDGKRQGRLLLEREGHWFPLDFSPDGTRLLLGHYVSINDVRLWLLDLESQQLTRVSPEEPLASYRDAVFGVDANTLYVATDRDGEFSQAYAVDVARGSWTSLTTNLPWNVESLAISHDRRYLTLGVNEDGYGIVYILDLREGTKRKLDALSDGVAGRLHFARNTNVLGVSYGSPTQAGDVYLYDLEGDALTRMTQSEVGQINPDTLVSPSLIRYDSFDGLEVPAYLYLPEGEGPHPVVILIHGGPEAQARPHFNPLLQYYVSEMGIAVLVPNVRGSDGYGKSYLQMDNGRKREDSVKDIGALLDWVATQDNLDANRVGVSGGSYGGYMVLASLVHFGERLRAGVNVVGISNFVTFLENTQEYRRDLRRVEYGDERDPDMRAFLEEISPLRRAHEIQSALFVAHGANDPRVPLSEADQVVRAVQAAGNDVWYMVAMNEGHGFGKRENRDAYSFLAAMFLGEHLTQLD